MTLNEASEALQTAQSVLVVTHVRPDGDAIGSLLGIANMVRALGKQVTAAVDGGVPDFLQFLPFAETVQSSLSSGSWDLVISTDAADEGRTGEVGKYGFANAKTTLNIDHHPTNPMFGTWQLVNVTATSACEVVFDWLAHMGVAYDDAVALPLLTGLVTDTNGFRTSSVTPHTLEVAHQLMLRGASLTAVTAKALDFTTAQDFALWQRVLPNAQLENGVATLVISLEDSRSVGIQDPTDAGLVSFLVNIDDVMVSAIFKEHGEDEVRLSLRAKRGYNVAEIAVSVGGGGHIQAAGATFKGTLAEAQAHIIPLLHEAVAKGKLEIV